jgi:DNA-binding NtrC family response regulator
VRHLDVDLHYCRGDPAVPLPSVQKEGRVQHSREAAFRLVRIDGGRTMAQKWSVLVVSEEGSALQSIANTLTKRDYRVLTAPGGDKALPLLERETVHAVVTDLKMRRVSGLDILREAHTVDPDLAVIMMTRFGSIASAVEAMRSGAFDYLTKPVNLGELEMVVQRAVAQQEVNAEVRELRRRLDIEYGFENIIGNSPAMRRIYRIIIQIATSAGTILLIGESGTGKELIARAIYRNSPRQHKHFIALNCAAFSEGLLENELFGHEPGAFTGANEQKRGLFELAAGGILFLDEISEISLTTQAKLLRVLETKEFLRVGGTTRSRSTSPLSPPPTPTSRPQSRTRRSARICTTACG